MTVLADKPRIEIRYCTQCRWLLRAAWLAQELLSTFDADLAEVALQPATGGIFQVQVGSTLIWCRKAEQGFPDAAELKRRVRDVIVPERPLGHIDNQSS
ncbi:SelT/SelW/SelH family protein [Parachitinimonas caeni]|uniref:SelT/SelW/SelH family protein n=1 Tax=Parachitinimonas caeni TaxID=3031301 RepID=A0ABT7DRF5_9NEIS|nr:SelT/SelW/SelH family protein [Parachitinimonas caeni]MDK2122653.1 SelT/SelW/SelH family protein [Parachitinimonas caeni]